jgi:hypothetical protein
METGVQKAFDKLKTKLQLPPILAYLNFKQQFILHTDASIIALGVVLSQVQKGKEVVIVYTSRTVSKKECKWNISELEYLT